MAANVCLRIHGLWGRVREHLECEYMNDNTIIIFSSLYMASSFAERNERGKCCAWRHFQFQSLAIPLPSTNKCEKYYHLLEDLSTTSTVGYNFFVKSFYSPERSENIYYMKCFLKQSVRKFCVLVLYFLYEKMHK